MTPLFDHWIDNCSAGMRQRIVIAAAFAGGHCVVILDEPFNWLDLAAQNRQAFDHGIALADNTPSMRAGYRRHRSGLTAAGFRKKPSRSGSVYL